MSKSFRVAVFVAVATLIFASPAFAQRIDPNDGGSIIVYTMYDSDGDGVVGPNDRVAYGTKVIVGHGTECEDVVTTYETLTFVSNESGRFDINDTSGCYFMSVVDGKIRLDATIAAPAKDAAVVVYIRFDEYHTYLSQVLK